MDGIENITARILEDARAEAQTIEEQAREKAQTIRNGFVEQAQRESAAILSRGEKAAAERLERLASAAQLERRKLELTARQQVLGEAFDKALDDLCGLPEENYIDLLADLALRATVSGGEELIFSQNDRARVGERVTALVNRRLAEAGRPAKLVLSRQTRPIRGGFVMSDGEVEVNCAFETLIRIRREKLEKEVADVLFA